MRIGWRRLSETDNLRIEIIMEGFGSRDGRAEAVPVRTVAEVTPGNS